MFLLLISARRRYELLLTCLFILMHTANIEVAAMGVSRFMWICLTSTLLHPYVSAFTSMMAQQIRANDRYRFDLSTSRSRLWSESPNTRCRALKSAPRARVTQLTLYLNYFQRTALPYFVNVVLYCYCYFLYIWVRVSLSSKTLDRSIDANNSFGFTPDRSSPTNDATGLSCISTVV